MKKPRITELAISVILLLVSIPAFAQSVETAWVSRYDGPISGEDCALDVAVDDSGNVYVTGYSDGGGTNWDYATIKYYPNGDTAWVRRYNGSGNHYDGALALALDGSGNICVTGYSHDTSSYTLESVTIKYNPSGNELWARKYDGAACDIAADGLNNVYVTGYATIKYDSSGTEAWVRRYDGSASGIVLDGSGNVYVTGTSEGDVTDLDYVTLKYTSSGNLAWARRFAGAAEESVDEPTAIAVDDSGNVYVTGYITTHTYHNPEYWDIATVKYDSLGNQLWARMYNGPGNHMDKANALAVDDSGNVYVTGGSYGGPPGNDLTTIKYDASGNLLWVRRYEGGTALALALDDSGNVYVTGFSVVNGSPWDYATIKYDANGNEQWVRRYNGPVNGYDASIAIVVDGSGNVYVTGKSEGIGTNLDYVTIKYRQCPSVEEELRVYDPGCGDKLILSWHPSSASNLEGYNVYRGDSSTGEYAQVNDTLVTDTVYLDQGLQLNTTYDYYIKTVASAVECPYTPEAGGTARYPVVLVHGLWADGAVWGPMRSLLEDDEFEHVWVPDLDGWGGHQNNATNLDTFIEAQKDSVRDFVDSTYGLPDVRPNKVNLIGHSMGGIISRMYVHNFNENVDHLIMLGTPNAGNWSANLRASLPGADSAIKELTTHFMRQTFDIEWAIDNVPGVHYHEVAGDYPWFHWPWCTYVYTLNDPSPNDEVVAVSSVFHTPAEDQIKTEMYHDNHHTIRENEETYDGLIFPWLTGSASGSFVLADGDYSAYRSSYEEDTLEQFLPTHLDSVFSAESKQHVLTVDSCEVVRLGISWCSGNLDVVLYNPYGTLIDSAYAENNDSVARGVVEEDDSYKMEFYAIANPVPGNWTLEVQAVTVSDSGEEYWVEGILESNLRLIGRTDSDFYSPNDTVVVTGELRRHTAAVVGADVDATINKPNDSLQDLVLFDDGLHHDGDSDDGRYGNIFTNTDLYGSYGVAVTATGSLGSVDFSRESFLGFTVSDITFIRGDSNRDGQIDVGDVVYVINYLFRSGPAPVPVWLGDANCDGIVNLGDVVYLINYLFRQGPPPCE